MPDFIADNVTWVIFAAFFGLMVWMHLFGHAGHSGPGQHVDDDDPAAPGATRKDKSGSTGDPGTRRQGGCH